MKQDIIEQYRKIPGARILADGCRIEMPLPADKNGELGRLVSVFPSGRLMFNLIDIRSTKIPEIVAAPIDRTRELKINYCLSGRCELRLFTGECTYLTAGEISVDAGQALDMFYYPGGEYKGFEVIYSMENDSDEGFTALATQFPKPEILYERCKQFSRPWIRNAGAFLAGFYEDFQYYIEEEIGTDLIFIKCIELLTYLSKLDFEQAQLKRTYYTVAQVEIAKRTKETITSDLSVRYTAKELADRFGISETSLKNYFRSVYGCGYAEYQQIARMEKAAQMLDETNEKIADISMAVGFTTQAKFGAAFKACFGVTPMEYRRLKRLKQDISTKEERRIR